MFKTMNLEWENIIGNSNMKIIGIVGSRRRDSENDFKLCEAKFKELYEEGDEIVSGGCPKGGDRFAERIAKKYGLGIKIYFPDWNKGKTAGFTRNTFIARDANELIACCAEDRTGGTEDTVKKFRNKVDDDKYLHLV